MLSKEATILNKAGLHARPAQLWVKTANDFKSQIKIKKEDGTETNGKSILGLMTLMLSEGTKITLEANGSDEEEAIEALTQLIEGKFGEE